MDPLQIQFPTRRERLKSAQNLRLKKSKVSEICPGRVYEKLRKVFWVTQRVHFMFDKTRKSLLPQLETKKKQFFLEKKSIFYSEIVA